MASGIREYEGQQIWKTNFLTPSNRTYSLWWGVRTVTLDELINLTGGDPDNLAEEFPRGAFEIWWKRTAKGKNPNRLFFPLHAFRDVCKNLLGEAWDALRAFKHLF